MNLRNYLYRAVETWANTNVRDIGYGELEDFILKQRRHDGQPLSSKTRANMMGGLRNFWHWLRRRGVLRADEMPEFPEVRAVLGWRKTVGLKPRQAILDEVYRLTENYNIRIWLGIKWLCTYISIRPKEMWELKEEEINVETGYFTIAPGKAKERRLKTVPILPEDIELIKQLPRGLPDMYFFRHEVPRPKGFRRADGRFVKHTFYRYWKRACRNLGVEGVDLYGGTRHSTTQILRSKGRTPEEIKRGTMHASNAFARYFEIGAEELREIYSDAIPEGRPVSIKRGQVIELNEGGE